MPKPQERISRCAVANFCNRFSSLGNLELQAMADYKNTLNLPETTFPMKGDLARREHERI